MKHTISLKQNHLFRRLYSKGRSAVDGRLAVYCRKNGGSRSRLLPMDRQRSTAWPSIWTP